ncbi:hypothetical protein D9M72_502620 [compost metagenome]
MDKGNRCDSSHGLLEALLGLITDHPARLHPQQRRHGLQVVFHPVMDLADGGVLGYEFHFPAPKFRNVTAEHQSPEPLLLIPQRDGPK